MPNPAEPIARPDILDDRSLLGHPRGLGLLFVVEMWERFSYYGMRAFLVLYLVKALKWPDAHATSLYGTYTSLVYLTPLIGGYLADRVIGTRRSLVLGGAIIALGHFCLAFNGMTAFYLGLGLIIIGTGFFKSNAATMVGQLYRPGDSRRDAGFTIYYMGVNLGAFLGPLLCGLLAEKVGWHWGFGAAGVGMVAGLATYLVYREKYLPGIGQRVGGQQSATTQEHGTTDGRMMVHGAIGAVVGAVVAWILSGAAWYPILLGVAVGVAVAVTVLGSHGDERKRVLGIFLTAFFVVFFWTAYEQAGSSMNLFADRHTALPSLFGWTMPATWFQWFNPVMIIVLAPVFAGLWGFLGRRGKEPSTPIKMVFGLFLLGIGFLFMVKGGRIVDGGAQASAWWLTLAYLFHTLGELCLSPVGLSYVSRLAPARYASLLMGAWYLANTIANKLSGALAGLTPTPGVERAGAAGVGFAGYLQQVTATNAGFFSLFVVIGLVGGALMLLFVPLIKRLTASADRKN
ncbi:peptide MFS transporter [Holophaga foetida]|uniref:peptide MFS transporter n=1 Tax=Holophaga foetida TaxID=35839 RepID=UPI00024725E0|nr:peptide MFS transporter [Holophaga foetida]